MGNVVTNFLWFVELNLKSGITILHTSDSMDLVIGCCYLLMIWLFLFGFYHVVWAPQEHRTPVQWVRDKRDRVKKARYQRKEAKK